MVNMPTALSHSMPSPDFDANMDDLVGKDFAKLLNFEEQEVECSEAKLTMGSVGSLGHATGDCKPCAWFHKPGGCVNAYNCTFCHLCEEGELKKRKKEKRKQAFSRASTTDTLDSSESRTDPTEDWSEAMPMKVPASECDELRPLGAPELCALDGASPLIEALRPLLASVRLLQSCSDASEPLQLGEAPEPEKPQKPAGCSAEEVVENLQPAEPAVQDRPLAPQTVTVEVVNGIQQVYWAVSASTLVSRDRSAVSPSFELSLEGRPVTFKLMLFPKESSQGRGGSCFKKGKGKGYIELKCEMQDVACPLSVRFFAGGQASRGPVAHDFRQTAVKGLPKEIEMWDLEKCVTNGGFVVGAEITPLHAP